MKLVGKIKDAHGLKGEMYVLVFSGDVSWLEDLDVFGLGDLPPRGSEPTPEMIKRTLKIQRAKPYKDGCIIKAEGIEDRTAAEGVKGQGFFIDDENLVADEGETIYLSEILGFEIVDPNGMAVGKIVAFSSNGAQDLLVVNTGRGQAEIPFVDAFTVEIDHDAKKIVMDLPEGLLEIGE